MFVFFNGFSQEIPANSIIANSKLSHYLNNQAIANFKNKKNISQEELAFYLREKYAERYFFNWKNFESRFKDYQSIYPASKNEHSERAADHMAKFSAITKWKLPFNYLNGEPVNAYAVRHLARQHKMVDVAFEYHYSNKNQTYLNYFKNQLKSLNTALNSNQFEQMKDGNGTYEAFRAGYRVLNWLQIHSFFLGETNYSDADQLTTIATLLQHGASLYQNNQEFVPGNHQTRGMSALAMLSIVLRDFKGTDVWYKHSMKLLEEHLAKEINDDGFQFERSVHYHMSDIDNYYYVYQLAKISNLEVNEFWEQKLKSLFTTLVKIAYPDGSAPVLQDDTDDPWAEKNNISGAITLGYLLFGDAEMGYLAENSVDAKTYWYLNNAQLEMLTNIQKQQPQIKSTSFPTTGYYIFREGWNANDKMMTISAGLDKDKPDHQHGDMLGVQAMAYGKVVLPNYQVRYSLPDYEFFKNSMVKNVALVDDELQGKKYKGNQGGSGFGKFGELPKPTVLNWKVGSDIEYFIGSHNGFEKSGIKYVRQVINVNNDFWIVKDNFKSDKEHTYKQVWQGHYSLENSPNLIRSTFDDAAGLDIFQLNSVDGVENSGTRGKQWSVISKKQEGDFSFATIIFPYKGFDNRINELAKLPNFKGWNLYNSNWKVIGENTTLLSKGDEVIILAGSEIQFKNIKISSSTPLDLIIKIKSTTLDVQSANINNCEISIEGASSILVNSIKSKNQFTVGITDEIEIAF
ncbi:heparinase II/III family protein [Lutibacter sp.]|uniref:heparinase II/III family protein n=1 Tax=Lutibacter sp. TaxID=1925666 RepID=UPI00356333C8